MKTPAPTTRRKQFASSPSGLNPGSPLPHSKTPARDPKPDSRPTVETRFLETEPQRHREGCGPFPEPRASSSSRQPRRVAPAPPRAAAAILLATGLALWAPPARSADPFRFAAVSDTSLGLWEGDRPVLVYNHGVMRKAGVPADRYRSTYVHPLYGLDGEVLTDDFPEDHYHHRGLFWAWPHVRVGDQHYDLWTLKGIEQRFENWLAREANAHGAVLGVANGWFVGGRKVLQEHLWLRVAPATEDGRNLDVELALTPLHQPLTLQGAEDKSYGGLTLRFAPRRDTVITTPQGQGQEDLQMTRLPWADLSARFAGRAAPSGAAIFIAADHPDYPPEWLTRHYGALCVGWPGVTAKTLPPGQTVRCRYRVWIHRGAPGVEQVKAAYDAYLRTAPPRDTK